MPWIFDAPSDVAVHADTYHRTLHRLRQAHAEALDVLRDVPAADATHAEWQRKQAWMARMQMSEQARIDELHRILADIPRTFETGEGGPLRLPVLSCGVVGHAPDCECATL